MTPSVIEPATCHWRSALTTMPPRAPNRKGFHKFQSGADMKEIITK